MESLKRLLSAYEKWVATNPDTVTDLETTSKWVSYFIAGRISDSTVVSELIYSLSNLLMLYNDRIIHAAHPNKKNHGLEIHLLHQNSESRLRLLLTTLEYCEVFIEISAKRLLGSKGKWILIAALQLAKAAARFFILRQSTTEIITSPALPALNRRAIAKAQKLAKSNGGSVVIDENDETKSVSEPQHSLTFKLKRSGRVVRKVDGAPPLAYRDLKPLRDIANDSQSKVHMPKELLRAEYLYVAKPLIHLATMGVFGSDRWHQFAVALACDLYSIRLYYQHRDKMTAKQKLEISRRCINLLLYLMRTPFYERHTQRRLELVLDFIATHVPFVKMVAKPLQEYIPHWQSTYFYLWST